MKKINLAFGFLLFSTLGSSFAMADAAPVPGLSPSLGVEAGFNLASLNGKNVNDVFASRLGFVAGGFLNMPVGPTLAIQPEVLYEQKGGKVNGNDYRTDYLEIPVLLDVTLIGPLGVLLGPSFAARIGSTGVSDPNDSDIGLNLGAQLNLNPLVISGRYEVGLTDVSKDQNAQNGTFTFLAGISFL
jgi:outer membrane immunogenic protein